MTTISWPPLTTELQTISGGETSTTTIEVPVTEGGVVTKTTYVLITVRGGTTGTVTITIVVPPFTTNMIVSSPYRRIGACISPGHFVPHLCGSKYQRGPPGYTVPLDPTS
jgi:hypothetical protein